MSSPFSLFLDCKLTMLAKVFPESPLSLFLANMVPPLSEVAQFS